MPSTKQNKVARLLQKELGDIFQKKSRRLFHNRMITVTVVRISPDLLIAKVYLSIYPSKNNEDTLALVRQHAGELRYELGNRIRHQVRKIPELNFFIDDSLDYIENIDRLLKEDQDSEPGPDRQSDQKFDSNPDPNSDESPNKSRDLNQNQSPNKNSGQNPDDNPDENPDNNPDNNSNKN